MNADDVVAIQQVLALYGHLLDDREFDRLAEVFAPDAIADYSSGDTTRILRGLDEITAFLRTANASSAHHMSDCEVFAGGAVVRARSTFFVPYTRAAHVPHRWYGGIYEDELIRLPAGWRVRSRTVRGRWQLTPQPGDAPLARHTF